MPEKPQPQTDPWAEAAKNFNASGQSGPAPVQQSGGDDDWKVWLHQSQDQEQPGWQDRFDQAFVAPHMAPPNEGVLHHVARGAANFGGGVIGAVTAPIVHPLNTLQGIGGTLLDAATLGQLPEKYGGGYLKHMGEGLGTSLSEHPEETIESGLGNIAGGVASGPILGKSINIAGRAVSGIPGAMERGGLNLGNTALGARGLKPFQWGANPARGAFQEGILPAVSKHSALLKAESVLPRIGEEIANPIENSSVRIPINKLETSIAQPVASRIGSIRGPGGSGPIDPLLDLHDSFKTAAPNASYPIAGMGARLNRWGNYSTPNDVWRTIRNIDENTRFNRLAPEVEGLNEVRQGIRSNLRGNLEEAVPEIKAPSQRYTDVMGASDTLERTMHGGTTLGKMASIPMFPIESAVGRGLYATGRGMSRGISRTAPVFQPIPELARTLYPPVSIAGSLANSLKKKE